MSYVDDERGHEEVLRTSAGRIQLTGAINETLGFSFAVNPTAAITQPELRFASFGGEGAAIRPELYRMLRTKVMRFPGWYIRSIPTPQRDREPFDILVPVTVPSGGMPEALEPGNPVLFWAVPSSTTSEL